MNDIEIARQKPLDLVVPWIHHKFQTDAAWKSGPVLAVLAKRLIESEVAPGGPYKNDRGIVDEGLNRCVAELFRYLNAPLPNVEAYVAKFSLEEPYEENVSTPKIPVQNDAHRHAALVIRSYEGALRKEAERAYASIIRVDKTGELSLLSEWFNQSLTHVRTADTAVLGAANLLTWIAYSAYDAILDGDTVPARLPVANATHRDALALYRNQSPLAYSSLAAESFTMMDEANAWELAHSRFDVRAGVIDIRTLPRCGNDMVLARRAAGHIVGPLALLRQAEVSTTIYEKVQSALNHYLIARQYEDDLHDWVDDFKNGHVSPVVAYLIRSARVRRGPRRIEPSIRRMRNEFWQSGLTALSNHALEEIIRAEQECIEIGMDESSVFITEVIRPIRLSLQRGLVRHAGDKDFLESYRKG